MQLRVFVGRLLFILFLAIPFCGQAQFWRVIKRIDTYAKPFGSQNYVLTDSVFYEYDANTMRGSNSNNDTIDYRLCYHYQVDNHNAIFMHRRTYCTYTNDDLLYTRAIHDANGVWERDTFFYRPNTALLDSHRFYNIATFGGNPRLVFHMLYKYEYDANGKITKLVTDRIESITGLPNAYEEDFFFYNTNDQLTQQTTRHFDQASRSWRYETRRFYNYDSSGNQASLSIYDVDVMNSKTELSFKKVSFYDTNNMLVVDSIFSKVIDSTTYCEAHAYTYDSLDRMLTDTLYYPIYNAKKVKMYSYTAFGYLDEVNTAEGVGLDLSFRNKYYYQEYAPVGVQELTADASDITLYPNPAINVLHIATSEAYTQGRIYNSMGQIVKLVNANSKQIDVTQLPAGNYYLQLSTNDKTMSKRFTVVR